MLALLQVCSPRLYGFVANRSRALCYLAAFEGKEIERKRRGKKITNRSPGSSTEPANGGYCVQWAPPGLGCAALGHSSGRSGDTSTFPWGGRHKMAAQGRAHPAPPTPASAVLPLRQSPAHRAAILCPRLTVQSSGAHPFTCVPSPTYLMSQEGFFIK